MNPKKTFIMVLQLFLLFHLVIFSGTECTAVTVDAWISSPYEEVHFSQGSFSIQAAINIAQEGDTVEVPAGIYNEQIIINKSVSLIGQFKANTIINGSGQGTLVQIIANYVKLANFTIQSSGQGSIGIDLMNCHNVSIIFNSIVGHAQGLNMKNSNNNTVITNEFTSNSLSIVMSQCQNNIISDNLFHDNFSPSINMYDCQSNVLVGNIIRNNPAYGIYLESCSNNILSRNNVSYVCDGIYLQNCHDIHLTSNTVTNTGPEAIHLHDSDNNIIENNTLSLNEFSLHLWGSTRNILLNNTLFRNKFGMKLWFSGNNTLRENNMTGNWWNFAIFGNSIQNYVNDVSTSNTVNNKPIYYVVNCHGGTVPSNVGYVAVINSTQIIMENLQLTENYQGLLIAYSNFTFIQNVTLMNNWLGLALIVSLNNTVKFCTFKDNLYHVFMDNSFGNIIYNNNFLGNVCKVDSHNSANIWDNGYPEGGNFWQFYTGLDFYHGINQNEIGGDGLGDTPYSVASDNIDHYPLVGHIILHEAGTWYNKTYYFSIISNVTITSLFFDSSAGPFVKLNFSLQYSNTGFCRLAIPNDLLWVKNGEWRVEIDNQSTAYQSYANENCNYVYLIFDRPSGIILIQGSGVIPERFPLVILLIIVITSAFHFFLARKYRGAMCKT